MEWGRYGVDGHEPQDGARCADCAGRFACNGRTVVSIRQGEGACWWSAEGRRRAEKQAPEVGGTAQESRTRASNAISGGFPMNSGPLRVHLGEFGHSQPDVQPGCVGAPKRERLCVGGRPRQRILRLRRGAHGGHCSAAAIGWSVGICVNGRASGRPSGGQVVMRVNKLGFPTTSVGRRWNRKGR